MNYYFFQIIIISKYFKVYSGWFSAARIYFLEIRTLKSLNLRTINSSTRKYILGYIVFSLWKKINSNSILQNLNSRNWRHFECISERGHADDCANSKTFLQQQVGKDLPCVIESLVQVWRIDDDILQTSCTIYTQYKHSIYNSDKKILVVCYVYSNIIL